MAAATAGTPGICGNCLRSTPATAADAIDVVVLSNSEDGAWDVIRAIDAEL